VPIIIPQWQTPRRKRYVKYGSSLFSDISTSKPEPMKKWQNAGPIAGCYPRGYPKGYSKTLKKFFRGLNFDLRAPF